METHAPYAQWAEGVSLALAGAVASVTVLPATAEIPADGSEQLSATATGSDGLPLATSFTWTTTDASVATVSPGGLVTATAPGIVTIRATAPGGVYDETTIYSGEEVFLMLASGAYRFDDAGPAAGSLTYDSVTKALRVDSDPAAPAAVKIRAAADGTLALVP